MSLHTKYGCVLPGEVCLSAKAFEDMDNISMAGVVRWLLELSEDELIHETHCGGTMHFDCIEDFMREKRLREQRTPNAEGQGCRASRHTLDPLVGSLNSGDKA